LRGFFKTLQHQGNEVVLYENSAFRQSFDINEVYERVAFAVIENFPVGNFLSC
jgi:hypothetical protein